MRSYGCHNVPRPAPGSTYPVQVGWTERGRHMINVAVLPSVAECRYDASATDERCAGCEWIRNHDLQRQ